MAVKLAVVWKHRSLAAYILWPLAALHGLLVRLRQYCYRTGIFRSLRFSVPVVVVGNVVAGGAGKTPLVIALVRHLQARGLQVGVVSRGYGRTSRSGQHVGLHTLAAQAGDEPLLIYQATGAQVFVANRRVDAVRALLVAHPTTQVVVCDDGLQHYALQRDLEIAVFDNRGVGNGWLLPAGLLREPWPERGNQGIDMVLHTGTRPAFGGYVSTRRLADHAHAADGSQHRLDELRGRSVAAIAGTASPNAFFDMLRGRGLTLSQTTAFADHHVFGPDDLADQRCEVILCTEKDAVKLFAFKQFHLWDRALLLAVPLEFTPEPAFFVAFDSHLDRLLARAAATQSGDACPLPLPHGHQTD